MKSIPGTFQDDFNDYIRTNELHEKLEKDKECIEHNRIYKEFMRHINEADKCLNIICHDNDFMHAIVHLIEGIDFDVDFNRAEEIEDQKNVETKKRKLKK
jgi:hypothetical protein